MEKVSRERATEEINGWLDKKKVYESTRESNKDNIELLIEAMMNGDLILEEKTNQFTHNLLFPLDDLKTITYKARLNDTMLRPHLQGIKPTDGDGRWLAHTAALTSQPKNLLAALDSADKRIMTAITLFFI